MKRLITLILNYGLFSYFILRDAVFFWSFFFGSDQHTLVESFEKWVLSLGVVFPNLGTIDIFGLDKSLLGRLSCAL